MKSLTEYLTFNVPARMDFVNSTGEVTDCVRRSGVYEGLVLVNKRRRSVQASQPGQTRHEVIVNQGLMGIA